MDGAGREVAERRVHIPCGGSLFWTVGETFSAEDLAAAGPAPGLFVRDTTCRLFGFHGLRDGDRSFCLDHMFGF
jgi:hypothetical protein